LVANWHGAAAAGKLADDKHPVRRSGVGSHDIREIGLRDLLLFAGGASVIDIGCNRGHIGYEFYRHGARLVHGCDIYGPGIQAARQWFAELTVQSKFEVVDLTQGATGLNRAFGGEQYDIVLFVGVLHKLKRMMEAAALSDLATHLGNRALKFVAWNGYTEDLPTMDKAMSAANLRRMHYSEFARPGVAAIWMREK
jgi:2-polyprenyl-3-methyl-5-hydroxy-6-metoxy-1,4-benzoquinol methylase